MAPRAVLGALGLGLALAVPLLVHSSFWLNLLTLMLFFGYLGGSWNILGGYAGQFSFGHAAFFGTGAYVTAILQLTLGLNPWLTLPLAAAGGAAVGLVTGFLSFRYGLRGSYFALITLAFAEVLRVLATTARITNGGQGLVIPFRAGFGNFQFVGKSGYYYVALGMTLVSLAVAWAIEHSRFGARLMAVRENEEAAEALGVNAFRHKLAAITLAGLMAGAGGTFYVQMFFYVDPRIAFGPAMSVESLLVSIIGGMGTIAGPLLGSVVLHLLGDLTRKALVDAPGISLVLYGVLLILILRYLPNGLIGGARALAARLGLGAARAGAPG